MPSLFSSHDLTMLISFADVVRTFVAEEVEARVNEARRERDVLIRCFVGLSTEEADVSFFWQEILDTLDRIEACVYNLEFRGIVMCLLDALFELCEVKDIKILKRQEHDVHLCLSEGEIRMADLSSQ